MFFVRYFHNKKSNKQGKPENGVIAMINLTMWLRGFDAWCLERM